MRDGINCENKQCYNDRIKISHKHDIKHFQSIKCDNDKVTILTFLAFHKDKYNDLQTLGNYQLYVRYISSLRFASPESSERIRNNKGWKIIEKIEEDIKEEIGMALQTIVPLHIPIYCALLYRLLTFDDIWPETYKHNKHFSKNNFYKQSLVWKSGLKSTILLPGLHAPYSPCNFLIRWCDLQNELKDWNAYGYARDINHQLADMAGLLAFYTLER